MNQNPSSLLIEYLHLLPKGRVLDIAMGRGRNALYLAEHGFEVEGVDIDKAAVRACQVEAAKKKVKIQVYVEDLNRYLILPDNYDVILCFNYLQRELIPKIKDGLKKGGIILYETFLIDHYIRFGKPRHKEYCFERKELMKFFQDFEVIHYKEGFVTKEKAVARIVARKKSNN